MEAMVMVRQPATAAPARRLRLHGPERVGFGSAGSASGAVRAARRGLRAQVAAGRNEATRKQVDDMAPVRLFVGLPMDSVTEARSMNHARAVSAGLGALKLLGADGVELPVFWPVVQPESGEEFIWAGYRAVADMVRATGLSLRVSLNIHGSPDGAVFPVPGWVAAVAAEDPDILFTDRSGNRHEDCLSFAVDELPVIGGKSPLQLYEGFFRSFASTFQDFFGSTITDVTVGLGPNGELRYPSYPPGSDAKSFRGVGEFQCYDKYMLALLQQHATASGHEMWGRSGPHDAPLYDEPPDSSDFFKEWGGSWDTPYGDFFLSWYAGQLVGHGDRVLTVANKVLGDKPVDLSAKVPFLHWWHGARSRPSEATAGFYKTNRKNGYSPVAKMFARHGCTVVVPGMDVCINKQHRSTGSSPEQLLVQIKNACLRHGARIAGENASLVMTHTSSFSRIRGNVLTVERMRPSHFTYQRMGAEFFSPEHWPLFTEFVRCVVCHEADEVNMLHDDDRRPAMSAGPAEPGNTREAHAL